MKKIMLASLLFIVLCLTGCSSEPSAISKIPKLSSKQLSEMPGQEELKTAAEKIFDQIGITGYKFERFGDYDDTHEYTVFADGLYSVADRWICARCSYSKNDEEWEVMDVYEPESYTHFYDYDPDTMLMIYDFNTGELAEGSKTLEDLQKAISEKSDSLIATSAKAHISSEYTFTTIDEIKVNRSYDDSGYIVLVNLTWDQKNSEATSEEVLKMYSDDLAAYLAGQYDDVISVALFWKVPYLTTETTKFSYDRKGDNMFLSDSVIGWK